MKDWYIIGAVISGIIVAILTWLYSFEQWGLLFGLLFGWLPALIAGAIGGRLWPLLAFGLYYLYTHQG